MPESFIAKITPVSGTGGPTDPDFGVEGPVDPGYGVLPPLPGYWPPPGQVMPPIHYPPVAIMPPIYIDVPEKPDKPPLPPVGIYPPLPPEIGTGGNKVAILVMVVGLAKGDIWKGYRWYVYEKPPDVIGGPPVAQPKR